jgi:hypothetical protein
MAQESINVLNRTEGVPINALQEQSARKIQNDIIAIVARYDRTGKGTTTAPILGVKSESGVTHMYSVYNDISAHESFGTGLVSDIAVPIDLWCVYLEKYRQAARGKHLLTFTLTEETMHSTLQEYSEYNHDRLLPSYFKLFDVLFQNETDASLPVYYYITIGVTIMYLRRRAACEVGLPALHFCGVYHWVDRNDRAGETIQRITLGVVQTAAYA